MGEVYQALDTNLDRPVAIISDLSGDTQCFIDGNRLLNAVQKRWRMSHVIASGVGLCALIGATAFCTWARTRNGERAPQPVRFTILPPSPLTIVGSDPEIATPDGSRIVYRGANQEGATQLVVRANWFEELKRLVSAN